MEAGIIIGSIGLIATFFMMSISMDEEFKKLKEYLINWKHFWMTLAISSTLILTASMKEIVIMNEGSTGLISLMNMAVTINIIIIVAWFFYLAIFTVLTYLGKFQEDKDNIKYE
jgi:uncharacterized membrane protein